MSEGKVTVGRKVIALGSAIGWKYPRLAEALGVATGTVATYKHRANANPTPDKVRTLVDSVAEHFRIDAAPLLRWIYDGVDGPPPMVEAGSISKITDETQTGVYHNKVSGSLDSGSVETLANAAIALSDTRTVRVKAIIGAGSRIWSVKGARDQEMTVSSYIVAGGRRLVIVEGDSLGVRMRGSVLAFDPDDYPYTGRYLLCASRAHPELLTIRVIDPQAPDLLADPSGEETPLPLTEWDVLGWAHVELTGWRTGSPDVNVRPGGIGPRQP